MDERIEMCLWNVPLVFLFQPFGHNFPLVIKINEVKHKKIHARPNVCFLILDGLLAWFLNHKCSLSMVFVIIFLLG